MYSTCLFCNGALGSNETVEHLPVGERLAFDTAKSRLWVVCGSCDRWNLTPFEERVEAIEECERAFRSTFVRVSTDNIGFARLRSGMELVRIGQPLRPEFAAWRYGRQLRKRRRRNGAMFVAVAGGASALVTGGAVAAGITAAMSITGPIGLVAIPAATMLMGSVPVLGVAAAREYDQEHRVIARFADNRRVLTVRGKHLDSIQLRAQSGSSSLSMLLHHDGGWKEFAGTEAMHAVTVILASTNRAGANDRHIASAVSQIEAVGDAEGFLAAASGRNAWRGGRITSILNQYRGVGAFRLSQTERLALEMAVHEETERRAMQGELELLESAWRDAEEIARIVDDELTPFPAPFRRDASR
jgi:hypothetical protein